MTNKQLDLWWKLIIVGLTGTKPYYKLFCSDDTPESIIEPYMSPSHDKAFSKAQDYAKKYQKKYKLNEWPRILLVQVMRPAVSTRKDLQEKVNSFLSDYMNIGFVELMRSLYWQKAVESNPELSKRLQLGFVVFQTMLSTKVPGWKEFIIHLSARQRDFDEVLRDCFESHYHWFHESHEGSAQAN